MIIPNLCALLCYPKGQRVMQSSSHKHVANIIGNYNLLHQDVFRRECETGEVPYYFAHWQRIISGAVPVLSFYQTLCCTKVVVQSIVLGEPKLKELPQLGRYLYPKVNLTICIYTLSC